MGDGVLDRSVLKDDQGISLECAALTRRLYNQVKSLLQGHYRKLEALATRLLEKETLDGDEVLEIVNHCPVTKEL
jgi:ATP-dependent Zn protease